LSVSETRGQTSSELPPRVSLTLSPGYTLRVGEV